MKKFEIWKIVFVILFSTVFLTETETVSAKGLLAKKKRDAAAVQENAPAAAADESAIAANSQLRNEISKQETEKKETASPENSTKKKNPFTTFFDNLAKSRKRNAESSVELPSEQAVPSADLRSTGRAGSKGSEQLTFSGEDPKDEKPPFEPSYGVDRSEKQPHTEEIPEQIVLEGTAPSIPQAGAVAEDTGTAAKAPEMVSENIPQTAPLKSGLTDQNVSAHDDEQDLSEIPDSIRLENHQNGAIAGSQKSAETSDLENSKTPHTGSASSPDENPNSWILESAANPQADTQTDTHQTSAETPSDASQKEETVRNISEMDSHSEFPHSEFDEEREDLEAMPPVPTKRALKGMDPEESLDPAYARSGNSVKRESGWNQEIPELEFMEQNDTKPLLNISPQRLVSPLERRNAISSDQDPSQSDVNSDPVSAGFQNAGPLAGSAIGNSEHAENAGGLGTPTSAEISDFSLPTELPAELPAKLSDRREPMGSSSTAASVKTAASAQKDQNEDSFTMLPPPLETSVGIEPSVGSAVQITDSPASGSSNSVSRSSGTAGASEAGMKSETEWDDENFGLLPSPLEEREAGDTPTKISGKERAELKVFTQAPQNVLVGVETQFQIQIRNVSPLASNGTSVEIAIPASFTVKKALTSRGATVILRAPEENSQRCVWNLETLPASAQETLILKVVPTETVSADLRVSWSNRHAEDRKVMVAELPKLQMELIPDTLIREGEENRVKIRVANAGNCIARNIVLKMETEGCTEQTCSLQGIPALLPGNAQIVEAVITPTSREKVKLCVCAQIQNQTYALAEHFFDVQFIDMNVQIGEPESPFAGVQTKFPVEIRNLGNTQAQNLQMCLQLPENAHFAGTEPKLPYMEAGTQQIILDLADTPEGHTQYFRVLVEFDEACTTQLPFTLQTDTRILSENHVPLQIEGITNVEMKLNFPERILSTSENGIYEVQLTNTGSNTIKNGQLFAYFSDGIEPNEVKQTANVMNEGIVSFSVQSLKPGESQTFQIHANAQIGGNYTIRCQFLCEEAGLDLIQQEVSIYR